MMWWNELTQWVGYHFWSDLSEVVLTLISFSEAIFFQSLEYMCWPARTKNHTVRTFLVLLLGVFENDLFWVPPKLAGSAIQMDRFHNTWAYSWTTTPGPIKWDLGASRLWRMQSDLFQSQSYRVPKFIFTLPAGHDISKVCGKGKK